MSKRYAPEVNKPGHLCLTTFFLVNLRSHRDGQYQIIHITFLCSYNRLWGIEIEIRWVKWLWRLELKRKIIKLYRWKLLNSSILLFKWSRVLQRSYIPSSLTYTYVLYPHNQCFRCLRLEEQVRLIFVPTHVRGLYWYITRPWRPLVHTDFLQTSKSRFLGS